MTALNSSIIVLSVALMGGCPSSEPAADAGAPGEAFWSPEGLAASDRFVLVANTAYFRTGDGKDEFGRGFVTIIDRKSRKVVGRVDTSQKNTAGVEVCGTHAYAVNRGQLAFDKDGLGTVKSGGGIDVLDLAGGAPAGVQANIPLGTSKADPRIGYYGSLAVDPTCKLAYLGSGTRGVLFSVDLQARKAVRGPEDPIAMFPTPAGDNGMTILRPWEKGLAVMNFNTEELCVAPGWGGALAGRTCGSIKVRKDILAGPIDVARAPDGKALVLMTMASAVFRVDTSSRPFTVEKDFAGVGSSSNRLVVRGKYAYVVNTLSNNLQRIELATKKSDLPWVVFPVGSNPYDILITREAEGDVAWITLLRSHAVAVVDLETGKLLTVIDSGKPRDGGPDSVAADMSLDVRPDVGGDAGGADADGGAPLVGAQTVVTSTFGKGAGFGQSLLPGVIQGGPVGSSGGSTDVLSLGVKGEIVLDFGPYDIVDGPGPDFIIFENPMQLSPYSSFAEPALVAVSAGGVTANDFTEFPCDLTSTSGDPKSKLWAYPGCAGVRPVQANVKTNAVPATDPAKAGGDPFDLATVKIKQARYLRLRDAGVSAMGNDSKGFDLDAVVLINYKKR